MKVLMVEPHKNAYESDIGNDLKSMQEAVGGSIEAAYFFEEPVSLVCNEEGKINGLELNRSVRNEDNEETAGYGSGSCNGRYGFCRLLRQQQHFQCWQHIFCFL